MPMTDAEVTEEAHKEGKERMRKRLELLLAKHWDALSVYDMVHIVCVAEIRLEEATGLKPWELGK